MIHGKKSRGRTAFTLIELLVVIAVIAILAALLLPALARSKDQARSIVCKNHLHEMGMALQMYENDYKGYPYGGLYVNNPNDSGNGLLQYCFLYWYNALQPYYSLNWTNPAYHCPAYNGAVGNGTEDEAWIGYYGSYSYNVYGASEAQFDFDVCGLAIGWQVVTPEYPPHSDSQIVAPSALFALMDAQEVVPYSASIQHYIGRGWSGVACAQCNGMYSQSSGYFGLGGEGGGNVYTNKGSYFPIPHGKAFNVACVDGHVSPIPASVLFNLTNSAPNWNVDHQPHPELWCVMSAP
jgi:prepilin-type N-terminal cleavage/methylation domain-containing protein/prepilin-type processing-associated H-X9-DG protein